MISGNSFLYSIKQGFRNIVRNKLFSLASISTIAACLFMFGIFYSIVCNFQYMLSTVEQSVGVRIFFEEGISEERIRNIGEQIEVYSYVKQVEYISAEEAWDAYKEEIFEGREELEESFAGENPLEDSASYQVYLHDLSRENEFVKYVSALDGVRKVRNAQTVSEGIVNLGKVVAVVSAVVLILMFAIAAFIISMTISTAISARKDEIAIMQLIGASRFLVQAPFIVEGALIGICGTIVPVTALYFLYEELVQYLFTKVNVISAILTFLDVRTIFEGFVPIALVIGIGIGVIISWLTVRRLGVK